MTLCIVYPGSSVQPKRHFTPVSLRRQELRLPTSNRACYSPAMPEILTQHGLLSLFLLSFCASTLLPLGSEWLLVALLLDGSSPITAILVASFGNSLGAVSSYLIGRGGSRWLIEKLLRINADAQQKAPRWFEHYGKWVLLLSWLPVVGDPLCLVAGSLKHRFDSFVLFVALGKTARYSLVALLTLTGRNLL